MSSSGKPSTLYRLLDEPGMFVKKRRLYGDGGVIMGSQGVDDRGLDAHVSRTSCLTVKQYTCRPRKL